MECAKGLIQQRSLWPLSWKKLGPEDQAQSSSWPAGEMEGVQTEAHVLGVQTKGPVKEGLRRQRALGLVQSRHGAGKGEGGGKGEGRSLIVQAGRRHRLGGGRSG